VVTDLFEGPPIDPVGLNKGLAGVDRDPSAALSESLLIFNPLLGSLFDVLDVVFDGFFIKTSVETKEVDMRGLELAGPFELDDVVKRLHGSFILFSG
jgi:hypothetical protein